MEGLSRQVRRDLASFSPLRRAPGRKNVLVSLESLEDAPTRGCTVNGRPCHFEGTCEKDECRLLQERD
jgi:hypothetical protein